VSTTGYLDTSGTVHRGEVIPPPVQSLDDPESILRTEIYGSGN